VGQYRVLGGLEVAGALGVLAGLVVVPLGLAAAVGLGGLMLGALRAHLVNRDGVSRLVVPLIVAGVVAWYAITLS
jgi:hypothetical protein